MTIGGEPWRTADTAPVSLDASVMNSPAGGEFRPWGTNAGARIITLTATRRDGRQFVLQVAFPSKAAKEEDVVHAVAEYRTTQGTAWRGADTACRARVTRLQRDAHGKIVSISVVFEGELRTKDEARPLVLHGQVDDVAVAEAEI